MEHASEDGPVARHSRSRGRSTYAAPPMSAPGSTPSSPPGAGDVIVDISRVDSIDMTTLKMLAVANRVAERAGPSGGAARRHSRRTTPPAPVPHALDDPARAGRSAVAAPHPAASHHRLVPPCDPSRRVTDPTSLTRGGTDRAYPQPHERQPRRATREGPSLGDADVRRPLDGRGVQRALPDQPGQGPDRPLGRLRPAHPDRLRPRRRR